MVISCLTFHLRFRAASAALYSARPKSTGPPTAVSERASAANEAAATLRILTAPHPPPSERLVSGCPATVEACATLFHHRAPTSSRKIPIDYRASQQSHGKQREPHAGFVQQ